MTNADSVGLFCYNKDIMPLRLWREVGGTVMRRDCEVRLERILSSYRVCAGVVEALSDPTRRRILLTLMQSDLTGIRVGEISRKSFLTRAAVSHHLRILREQGIVGVRREGTRNYYYLSADREKWRALTELADAIYEGVCALGDGAQKDC